MKYEIIDGDGHVTETWEQIAKHLDEPYRKRPLQSPLFPQDAWDRRLIASINKFDQQAVIRQAKEYKW